MTSQNEPRPWQLQVQADREARRQELDTRAEKAAKGARCTSCGVRVLDEPVGIAYGWATFPGTGRRFSFQFCHRCAVTLKPDVIR
jgi:hypothetical protein